MTERMFAGFAAFVGVLAGTAFLWPRDALLPHPLAALGGVSSAAALQLVTWAGILGFAALVLVAGFALGFRRLALR